MNLVRGLVFGGRGLIRGVTFGGSGLIRGVIFGGRGLNFRSIKKSLNFADDKLWPCAFREDLNVKV
jgi:hypothetical protein